MSQYPTGNVDYLVSKNCMKLIADGSAVDAFEALGISDEDFRLATSNVPFIAADRPRVVAVLNALCHGTLDVTGLPRIEVPMEYLAAIISTFVNPGNIMIACRWVEIGNVAEDIAAGGTIEPCNARQLFALCCMLYADAPRGIEKFLKKTGRAIENATKEAVDA